MNELTMAEALIGSSRINPGQTVTVYGVASSDSEEGLVMVDMGGDTISPDDDQSIECETTFKVYAGDDVIVSLIGADGSGKTPIVIGVVGRGDEQENKVNALRERASELQNEIRETADETVERSVGANEQIMTEAFLARSSEGLYAELFNAQISETARQIRESFTYESLVEYVPQFGAMEQYLEVIDGEIKRGFVVVDNKIEFGIVVSSRNVFKAAGGTYTPSGEPGNVYYEIDTGECYGLYTATGWQFWQGNRKLAWFDTSDGQLHVNNIKIEANFIMGDWRFSNKGNSFGIKYVGE